MCRTVASTYLTLSSTTSADRPCRRPRTTPGRSTCQSLPTCGRIGAVASRCPARTAFPGATRTPRRSQYASWPRVAPLSPIRPPGGDRDEARVSPQRATAVRRDAARPIRHVELGNQLRPDPPDASRLRGHCAAQRPTPRRRPVTEPRLDQRHAGHSDHVRVLAKDVLHGRQHPLRKLGLPASGIPARHQDPPRRRDGSHHQRHERPPLIPYHSGLASSPTSTDGGRGATIVPGSDMSRRAQTVPTRSGTL